MNKTKEREKLKISYSAKQKAVADAIINGDLQTKTRQEIVRSSGYSPITAKAHTTDVFTSEGVKQALIAQGIDLNALTKPAIDAMTANKGSFFQGEYYKTKEPDHIVRLKGMDLLADITGLKKQVIENRNINVNVDYGEIADVFS